mmetsp:Transcript_9136/g.9195  ORF Transcript_9136/g.9195 Transcript_9136/m.9195 type:complete len:408 (-) Transcript_9136:145-1368(-)
MMQDMVNVILSTLDSLSADVREKNRAVLSYMKGKALNCFESYNPKSEELLSLSVKLDPTNYNAWTSLGQCLWKKGDRIQARNCFLESINQTPSKEALWEMTILMRQLQIKGQSSSASVEESIKLAKQAIALDINHHKSWYLLGNAMCTYFFSTSYNKIDLMKAMNCYKRSESLGGKDNPDLYMNSGNVMRYMQSYMGAIQAYTRAYELDPSMKESLIAKDEIIAFLNKVNNLVEHNGKIRKSRLDQLTHQLRESSLATDSVNVKTLCNGTNDNILLAVKPILPVSKGTMPPKSVLCVDKVGCLLLLSIYDIGENSSQFTSDDVITILNPFLRQSKSIDLMMSPPPCHSEMTKRSEVSSEIKYEVDNNVVDNLVIIQIFDVRTLRLNGNQISRSSLATPELKVETFNA